MLARKSADRPSVKRYCRSKGIVQSLAPASLRLADAAMDQALVGLRDLAIKFNAHIYTYCLVITNQKNYCGIAVVFTRYARDCIKKPRTKRQLAILIKRLIKTSRKEHFPRLDDTVLYH